MQADPQKEEGGFIDFLIRQRDPDMARRHMGSVESGRFKTGEVLCGGEEQVFWEQTASSVIPFNYLFNLFL